MSYIKSYNFKTFKYEFDQIEKFGSFPLIYILINKDKHIAYIGETSSVIRRMKDHSKDPKRKNIINETLLITSNEFNKSATFNIETNLIDFFFADAKYLLQNISQKNIKVTHNYYNKKYFNETVFKDIWNELLKLNIVTDTLENIKNKDLYKFSPYKALSQEQFEAKNNILQFIDMYSSNRNNNKKIYTIHGDAGTGKSVLLSSIFKELIDRTKDKSFGIYNKNVHLLVNHEELVTSFKNIIRHTDGLKVNSIMKPTSFINKAHNKKIKSDIVIIDEGHLLLSRTDSYNNFNQDNQLDEIIKIADTVILFFDVKQFLKAKSYWDINMLKKIESSYDKTIKDSSTLSQQYRMNCNIEVSNWINDLTNGTINSIPKSTNEFELKYFDNFKDMHKAIIKKNKKYGLSRIVSTFDFIHKKDGKDYYVELDNYKLPWNRNYKNKTWSEINETINEVGSIYTIQGFDLNYVGVIIGPSIIFDTKNNKLILDTEQYRDIEAYRYTNTFDNEQQVKEQIILNSLNVLLKRGMKGLYICSYDKSLKDII